MRPSIVMAAFAAASLLGCSSPAAVSPTATAGPTASPTRAATATPAQTPAATTAAPASPTGSPSASSSGVNCQAVLTAADVGANFTDLGLTHVPQSPDQGWLSGIVVRFQGSGPNQGQSIDSSVECFDTPANAQAAFDSQFALSCLNDANQPEPGTVLNLPSPIGAASAAVFCPASGGVQNIPPHISVRTLVGTAVGVVTLNVANLTAASPDLLGFTAVLAAKLAALIGG
jgi:hypothetical protein